MSKLGDIYNSYGKQFSIAIANTYISNIINSELLPKNTIIISSPYDINTGEDLGTPSILITDNYGEPIILSKSIEIGNGLLYSNDSLLMSIDNNTINTENGKLKIDINNIIDANNGLDIITYNDTNKIYVNNSYLNKASASSFGIVSVDNVTILCDNGTIYVNTNELDHATDILRGVVIGDNYTIQISNGTPNVITDNLTKSGTSYGVAKTDNVSIKCLDGTIYINEDYLISDNKVGLLKSDDSTILSNDGILYVNEDSMPRASETSYGVVKYNDTQFEISEDGQITVKNLRLIESTIYHLSERVNAAAEQVEQIENEISNI